MKYDDVAAILTLIHSMNDELEELKAGQTALARRLDDTQAALGHQLWADDEPVVRT